MHCSLFPGLFLPGFHTLYKEGVTAALFILVEDRLELSKVKFFCFLLPSTPQGYSKKQD